MAEPRDMLITIVGNRPQFVKMAPVSAELRRRGEPEFIIHTGQHFDANMSDVFFEEMRIPAPDVHLAISERSHGRMTAEMMIKLEDELVSRKPKAVLIYGDTNSTLAAALVAVKLHIPIAHVEAGARMHDIDMPEEINRIVADHAARLRFCPDSQSIQNLAKENISAGVIETGDLMLDSFRLFAPAARARTELLRRLGVEGHEFALLTAHRPNNTDHPATLRRCIEALSESPLPIVFAMHPRTRAALERHDLLPRLEALPNVSLTPAVGYVDILTLVQAATIVVTDSGGLQKEAYFAGKPCLIIFHATPWPNIRDAGWQKLVQGFDNLDIGAFRTDLSGFRPKGPRPSFFGDGEGARKVVDALEEHGYV
jgi:UDP-N-acetylglucosamine 2-epimerase